MCVLEGYAYALVHVCRYTSDTCRGHKKMPQHQVSSSIDLHTTFWDWVSHWIWSLTIWLHWLDNKLQGLSCLHFPSAWSYFSEGYAYTQLCTEFDTGWNLNINPENRLVWKHNEKLTFSEVYGFSQLVLPVCWVPRHLEMNFLSLKHQLQGSRDPRLT